jgi:hypothetical protein
VKDFCRVVGMIALAYLALRFDSFMCGLGAVVLFCCIGEE